MAEDSKPNNELSGYAKTQAMSLLEGQVLDMVAAGKTPRQIAETLGLSPAEASKMAYELLEREIITDTAQRRNLQVYRLERIVDALWERAMKHADRDDIKNLHTIIQELNTLLGLYKEADEELYKRMHEHQLQGYLAALMGLMAAFRRLAPDALPNDDEWAIWGNDQLQIAQRELTQGNPEDNNG